MSKQLKNLSKNSTSGIARGTRDGFGIGLAEAGGSHKNLIALSADLSGSLKMDDFISKYPNRFIQVGIAEQNMAGVAAGLALEGKIPFIGSFACFQPMRNLDQIRSSICIMNLPVKIASSHAGFSYAADGVQIQALEDIAIMRSLPNMKVLVPGDAAQAAQMVGMAIDVPGPVYIRLGRAKTESIEGHKLVDTEVFSPIEFGRAQMLRRGSDATIIATGYTVMLALKAAAELAQRGIHVTVINMHTIKPIDAEEVKRAAAETRRILTIEEHQVTGGLGGAVAEVLASCGLHCKLDIMGVNDEFGRTAREESELWELKGLNISNVIAKIKALLTWYP